MLISEYINTAGRKLGLIESNASLTAFELANGLSVLQSMLRSWAAALINITSVTRETFALTAGTGSYTWGTGGVINTVRPNKLTLASITSGTTTSFVDIITDVEYERIPAKSTTGTPYVVFPLYSYPLATLYLYPVPSVIVTLNLSSIKPFTETASFSALSDTLALPAIYEEPIIYNLAIRMASEYGVPIGQDIVELASSSYSRLIALNASNNVTTVPISVPAGN